MEINSTFGKPLPPQAEQLRADRLGLDPSLRCCHLLFIYLRTEEDCIGPE